MSAPTARDRAARFVGALRQLHTKQDRGALAALRRGLSSATLREAWPVVSRLGGDIGADGNSEFVQIAALFAEHPLDASEGNFGDTCRAISTDDKGALIESHERRFRRLLAADSREDLAGQLRAWVRLAAGKGVAVNYEQLFLHLRFWPSSADDIRVRWARAFWRSGTADEAPDAASGDAPATTATALSDQA